MNMLASTNRVAGNTLVSLWPSMGAHHPLASWRGLQQVFLAGWCWYWLWPQACHYTLSPPSSMNAKDLDKIILRASLRLVNKNNSSNQWHWQDIFYCNYRDQAFLLSRYTQPRNEARPLSFIFSPTYFSPPLSPVLSKTITGPAKAILL